MTTIAYKDGIIAYDSRSTQGSLITSDKTDKKYKCNDVLFFYCGTLSDLPYAVEGYIHKKHSISGDSEALVIDQNKLILFGMDETGCWWETLDLTKTRAIGSGSHHAYTAMDMGASAAESVKMAMLRDTCTGGRIRTYKIK